MIEIVTPEKHEYLDDMLLMVNIITWLLTEMKRDKDKQDVFLRGYLLSADSSNGHLGGLLFAEDESQQAILKILLQPPGEFKGKYIARVLCEEPQPVKEITSTPDLREVTPKTETDDEDLDELPIDIDKT